jgi:DNA-binding NarL/FixJ family response regulator
LQRILSPDDEFEIVAECADGAEALEALRLQPADVVVMDVRMRGMDGVEATRRVRDADGPPVLVLTTFDDDDVLWGAIEAGAAGFILKEATADDLVRATRTVAGGGSWIDPVVLPRVLAAYRATVVPHAREARRLEQLSDRELEVLKMMATGATNAEIANDLVVSGATIKTHIGSIFAKLGTRDRAGAIVLAYQHGIVGR